MGVTHPKYNKNPFAAVESDDVFCNGQKGLFSPILSSEESSCKVAAKPFIQKILSSSKKSDHFKLRLKVAKQLVTFCGIKWDNW